MTQQVRQKEENMQMKRKSREEKWYMAEAEVREDGNEKIKQRSRWWEKAWERLKMRDTMRKFGIENEKYGDRWRGLHTGA